MTKVETGHFNMSKSDKGSFLFNTVQALQRMQKKKCEIKQFFEEFPRVLLDKLLLTVYFFSLPWTLSDEFPGTLV